MGGYIFKVRKIENWEDDKIYNQYAYLYCSWITEGELKCSEPVVYFDFFIRLQPL